MIWLVPALFGIACAATVRSAVRSGRRGTGIIGGLLFALWALSNAAWVSDGLWLLPVFDLGLGIVALYFWQTTQARWVALVAEAVAVRLVLHVLDMLTGHLFLVPYIHALNATFAWMLVVVATGGEGHGADTLLRGFRRFCALLSASPAFRRLKHGR